MNSSKQKEDKKMSKIMKEIYQDWETLVSHHELVPNYFIDVNKGTDYFKLRKEIMTNIDKYHLVDYSSDIRCLIYDLNNTRSTRYETLLSFFNLYKNDLMKFNIPYEGVLMLDITSYVGYEDSEEFKAIISFLVSVSEGVKIFFLSEKDANKNNKMFEALSKSMWIERATYHNDSITETIKHVKSILSRNNAKIAQEDESKVQDIISDIAKNSENDAFKCIESIFNKIIYKKIKSGLDKSIIITESDLKEEYITKKKSDVEVLRMF